MSGCHTDTLVAMSTSSSLVSDESEEERQPGLISEDDDQVNDDRVDADDNLPKPVFHAPQSPRTLTANSSSASKAEGLH